ncbi:Single-strand binding protein family [Carex littledalei]|uniref:Single-strand binding protein family n=1 Tax=Carex littledalei TaxID=544730 RepID=A0A833VGH7_9POAL|nr:Single-strand binding protein family [Carex littledalei]
MSCASFELHELEGDMDTGLFKVILVGKGGQAPMQRHLRSGKEIVLFFLATNGIRNNCRSLPNERPEEYEAQLYNRLESRVLNCTWVDNDA